jgi:threonine synthase
MDIQVSSNFERLLFDACSRDAHAVRSLMGSLAQSHRFAVSARTLKELRAMFTADRANDQESAAEIRAWMREANYCVDPHTAVALAVAEKETRDSSVPTVVLSTAHPAKFPEAVKAACGISPALPEWLADLPKRKERVTVLPVDQAAVERYVTSASRAAREGAAA